MPLVFIQRLLDNSFLQVIEFTHFVGLLLDSSEQQGMEVGMVFFDPAGDAAKVGLPFLGALPNEDAGDESRNTEQRQEGWKGSVGESLRNNENKVESRGQAPKELQLP